jgi:hypothetical protein
MDISQGGRGGLAELTMPPGTEYTFTGSNNPQIRYRCSVINDGSVPIHADLIMSVSFREVEKSEKGLRAAEKISETREWPISIGRIEPGANNPFQFYILNMTQSFVTVQFPDTASIKRFGSTDSKNVDLIENNGRKSFGFPPPFQDSQTRQ